MVELQPIPEGGDVVGASGDKPPAYAGGAPEDLSPEAPKSPNSVYIPLGRQHGKERRASLSWQSDNPIMVLALIMLVIVVFAMILGAICILIRPESNALSEMEKVLGQALLILVGVIGGASASSTKKD